MRRGSLTTTGSLFAIDHGLHQLPKTAHIVPLPEGAPCPDNSSDTQGRIAQR